MHVQFVIYMFEITLKLIKICYLFIFFCIILSRLEINTLWKPCKRYDSFELILVFRLNDLDSIMDMHL